MDKVKNLLEFANKQFDQNFLKNNHSKLNLISLSVKAY